PALGAVADQAADDVPTGRLAQLAVSLAVDADDAVIADTRRPQIVARERLLIVIDDAPQRLAGHFDEFHADMSPQESRATSRTAARRQMPASALLIIDHGRLGNRWARFGNAH